MVSDETLSEQRAKELELVRTSHGGTLKPEDVVEFAKDDETALHSAFTWNDGEAASAYRLWQARQVIRVCVTIREGEKGPPIPVYVSLYEDRGTEGYRRLVDVMSDEERREKLLQQALGELKYWKAKYSQLEKLTPVFKAADKVERLAGKTKSSVRDTGK